MPVHNDKVVESMTSTMVERIQMLASETAFCFMRNFMFEMLRK